MKFHKSIIVVSFILIICLIVSILIWNTQKTPTVIEVSDDVVKEDEVIDLEKAKKESIEIASLYKDLYVKAEKRNRNMYIMTLH